MDPVRQVMETLTADETKARDGVGLMLFAIRLTTDQATFDAVKQVYPDAQELFTAALAAGGRTAEMLAIANPDAIRKKLEKARYTADEIARLGGVMQETLIAALEGEAKTKAAGAVDRVASLA